MGLHGLWNSDLKGVGFDVNYEIIFKQCVALDTIKVASKGSENKHHGSGAAGANEYPAQLFTFQAFWSSWLGTRDSIWPFRYEPFE